MSAFAPARPSRGDDDEPSGADLHFEIACASGAEVSLNGPGFEADLRPDDRKNRIGVADQLYALDRREEAAALYRSVLSPPSPAVEALRGLGRIAMVDGDPALAQSCWHLVNRLDPQDVWARHNQATCLMRMGRLEEAELAYREQLKAFPEFLSSWRGLAQAADAQGRPEESLAHLAKALGLSPRHLQTHFDCVRLNLSLLRLGDALRHLEAAAEIAHDDPRIGEFARAIETAQARPSQPRDDDALRLGEGALKAGHWEEALALLSRARESSLDNVTATWGAARCLIELDRGDEAEPLLAALAGLDPPHAGALAALGRRAARKGRAEEARRLLTRAAELAPDDLWLRNDLGHIAVDLGDLELADRQFALLISKQPNFFHAWRGIARAAKARGDLAGALANLERALEVEPDDPWIACEIASLEASLGRANATDRLRALLERRPDFTPAHQGLARLLRQAGDHAGAAKWLSAACTLRPDEAWLRFDLALASRALSDHATAARLLRELAKAGEASAAARLELFYLLRDRGEDAEAAAWLRDGLAAAPDDPHLLVAEANRLQCEGRLADAEAIYDSLARTDRAPYWRRVGKGLIARRRGLAADARQYLLDAIAIEPTEAAAYAELCEIVATDGEAEEALRRIDCWIAAAPRQLAARMQKARLFRGRHDYEGALAEWRAIAEIWPDRAEIFAEMSLEQDRLGDAVAATNSLDRAAALDPEDPALLEALARRAEWRDDLEEARRQIARALEMAPGRRWLRAQLARIQFLAGDSQEALAALERFSASGPDPDLEFLRVDMLRQTGLLQEAAVASQAAQARFGGHLRLRQQGACLAIDLGWFKSAALAIRAATPINRSEQASVHFANGYLVMAQWDFGAGRVHLQRACGENPADGWALNRLIHCDLMLFDMEAAGAHLAQLAQLNRSFNLVRGKSTSFSQTHYGQIFDEFRLDAHALESTRAALETKDPASRLAALREGVRQFPDYTPGCMAALLECRRAGLLDLDVRRLQATIPATIAQFWDAAECPADLAPYLRSWPLHNSGFAYRRFDATSAEAELAALGLDEALRALRRADQPAMQADIFRLAWLYARGGTYADADDRCLSCLTPLLARGVPLVLYQEDLGTVGNNFIMAAPGHPVVKRALDQAVQAVNQGAGDLLWLATGPGALTRAFCAHVFESEAQWVERLAQIRVLDRHEMLGYAAIHCHSGYKTTERHWSRTAFGRGLGRTSDRRNTPRTA